MFIVCSLLSPLLMIMGFSGFTASYFKIPSSICFFIGTSFLGVLLFLFSLFGILQSGTTVLFYSGLLMAVYQGYLHYFKYPKRLDRSLIYYGSFAFGLVFLVWGLHFRSIDDYSFWGAMSKYLYIFHKLPENTHYIEPYFLTYLPGMGCFHYLFYFAVGKYSQFVGYFAQAIVLLSALFTLFEAENPRKGLSKMALGYLILSLGYGTVFARMEVDAYVAVYFFTVFWIIYKYSEHKALAYIVFFPLLFLSLIKEIGFLFAIMGCITYLLSQKNKRGLFYFTLLILSLFALKAAWVFHCNHLGFHSFAKEIHRENALFALNPLNGVFYKGQGLFLKAVFFEKFGPALPWPNLFTYCLLGFIWLKLPHMLQGKALHMAISIKRVFLIGGIIYLVLLYLLQVIVFDVGKSIDHLLDFQRYFNMFLIPFTLFSVFLYFEKKDWFSSFPIFNKNAQMMLPCFGLFFIFFGKIERLMHYYPKAMYPLVAALEYKLPQKSAWTLCLKNPPDPDYEVTLPLRYFFLPHKILTTKDFNYRGGASCDYWLQWSTAGIFLTQSLNSKRSTQIIPA